MIQRVLHASHSPGDTLPPETIFADEALAV
jgi:hypothetical protein